MNKFNEYELCTFFIRSGYPISNIFPYVYVSSDMDSTEVEVILEHKKTLDKINLIFNVSSNKLYKYYSKLKLDNQTPNALIKLYLTDNFDKIVRINKINKIL